MNIATKCPICKREYLVHLTMEQTVRFNDFRSGKGHIQDLLPDLSADDRERLLTGICPECWKTLEETEDE